MKIALVQTSVVGSILSMMNSEIKRARQQNLTHKENKWSFGALSEYEKRIEMRGYFVFSVISYKNQNLTLWSLYES